MVRLSILAIIATAVTSVAAGVTGNTCQCLYADGSHCCVTLTPLDCQSECRTSGSKNGACNADGKWSSVSWFTALGRHQCTF